MKAIILVAGAGRTLRPHTHTQPKPLIPVAGKPILGHIVDRLLESGYREMIFVVGYMGEKIKDYVRDHYSDRITFEFVEQEPRLGIAHAIWLCRGLIRDPGVLIMLGDTIVDVDMEQLHAYEGSIVGVKEVEDPRKFGVALLDEEGCIKSLVEKPAIPKSNLALVGLYRIRETRELIEALDELIEKNIQTHSEFQLTDALMLMTRKGLRIRTQKVNNWFDCGRKDQLLASNRILLGRMTGLALPDYPDTVFVPPVFIDPACDIHNSVIGPYVAIAEHASIRDSVVQDSILGAYSRLDSIVLKHSIVGNDSCLIGRSHSINIGDNTEIDFNS